VRFGVGAKPMELFRAPELVLLRLVEIAFLEERARASRLFGVDREMVTRCKQKWRKASDNV